MNHSSIQIIKWGSRAGLLLATVLFVFFWMCVQDCYGRIDGGVQGIFEFFTPAPSLNAFLIVRMFQAVVCSCLLLAGSALALKVLRTFALRYKSPQTR